jgi:hypothetical protein
MQSYSQVPDAIRSELKWEVERGLLISEDSLAEAGTIAREWSALLEDLIASKCDVITLPNAQL